MTVKQKKIVLVVGPKLYTWIREEAHHQHISINQLIRTCLLNKAQMEDEINSFNKGGEKT